MFAQLTRDLFAIAKFLYKRLQSSDNIVLRFLGRLKHDAIVAYFFKNMVFVLYAAQYLTLNKRFGWTL